MSNIDRRQLGAAGEKLAEEYLRSKGYRWRASNWRTKWGEIDLVMQDGTTVVFVEVKTRQDGQAFGAPAEAVTNFKRAHVIKSALAYLQKTGTEDVPVRFDVVSVSQTGIEHFPDAFGNEAGFYS